LVGPRNSVRRMTKFPVLSQFDRKPIASGVRHVL